VRLVLLSRKSFTPLFSCSYTRLWFEAVNPGRFPHCRCPQLEVQMGEHMLWLVVIRRRPIQPSIWPSVEGSKYGSASSIPMRTWRSALGSWPSSYVCCVAAAAYSETAADLTGGYKCLVNDCQVQTSSRVPLQSVEMDILPR
jgi:hypothetical protein